MKTKHLFPLCFIILHSDFCLPAFAQGSAFTYQGRLNLNGAPANGSYDLRFTFFPSSGVGGAVTGPLTNSDMIISNGLFTVTLDFGTDVFSGADRWLEIAVRTNGGGAFATLTPRQQLTATPYAITAGNLSGVLPSASLSGPYANAVALNNGANSFSGNGANLTALNAAQLASGTVPAAALGNAWRIGGNVGTTPGPHFLGTTDNQALELKVNNQRVLRLEPNDSSPNLIGGYAGNSIGTGSFGSVIAGGGYPGLINTMGNNAALSVIGGGYGNTIAANAAYALIAGGSYNDIGTNSESSAIGGGYDNNIAADSPQATINGGYLNDIGTNSRCSAIGGGNDNNIAPNSGGYATIAGGRLNAIGMNSPFSAIGGGSGNNIAAESWLATIAGGRANDISTNSDYSAIGGGYGNIIAVNSEYATIPGGGSNAATSYAFAAGYRAKANHFGAFVWADSTDADFASTGENQFCIRANGGVQLSDSTPNLSFGSTTRQMLNLWGTVYGLGVQNNVLYTRSDGGFAWFNKGTHTNTANNPGSGGTALMTLDPGGNLRTVTGTLSTLSDRHAKTNFEAVDARAVLERVAALPIMRWNFKSAPATQRHLGPMAQDFYAAFNIGLEDTGICTVDADGVALAAIQGLNEKVEAVKQKTESRMEKLESENGALRKALAELKGLVEKLGQPRK